jgi:hypothetical protein
MKFTENVNQIIKDIYSKIYVSIGGKIINIHDYLSIYQIVPNFLFTECNDFQEKILIILIDTFYLDELNMNKQIIKNHIEKTNNEIDLTILVINNFLDKNIIDFILTMFKEKNRNNTNVLICNCVCFFSERPNKEETEQLRNMDLLMLYIKEKIKNTTYNLCLYKWFGNKYKFNKYIYKYNLESVFPYVINKIHTMIKQFELGISTKQNTLLKNIINLQSFNYYCVPETFAPSLFDLIQNNDNGVS